MVGKLKCFESDDGKILVSVTSARTEREDWKNVSTVGISTETKNTNEGTGSLVCVQLNGSGYSSDL